VKSLDLCILCSAVISHLAVELHGTNLNSSLVNECINGPKELKEEFLLDYKMLELAGTG
jgi:hypothetical protein